MATRVERSRKQFGARVRYFRKLRGWDLEGLATRLGKSSSALSRIETGKQNLTMVDIVALAQVLEVPVRALFDEEEQEGEVDGEVRQLRETERGVGLTAERCRTLAITLHACAKELDAALATP